MPAPVSSNSELSNSRDVSNHTHQNRSGEAASESREGVPGRGSRFQRVSNAVSRVRRHLESSMRSTGQVPYRSLHVEPSESEVSNQARANHSIFRRTGQVGAGNESLAGSDDGSQLRVRITSTDSSLLGLRLESERELPSIESARAIPQELFDDIRGHLRAGRLTSDDLFTVFASNVRLDAIEEPVSHRYIERLLDEGLPHMPNQAEYILGAISTALSLGGIDPYELDSEVWRYMNFAPETLDSSSAYDDQAAVQQLPSRGSIPSLNSVPSLGLGHSLEEAAHSFGEYSFYTQAPSVSFEGDGDATFSAALLPEQMEFAALLRELVGHRGVSIAATVDHFKQAVRWEALSVEDKRLIEDAFDQVDLSQIEQTLATLIWVSEYKESQDIIDSATLFDHLVVEFELAEATVFFVRDSVPSQVLSEFLVQRIDYDVLYEMSDERQEALLEQIQGESGILMESVIDPDEARELLRTLHSLHLISCQDLRDQLELSLTFDVAIHLVQEFLALFNQNRLPGSPSGLDQHLEMFNENLIGCFHQADNGERFVAELNARDIQLPINADRWDRLLRGCRQHVNPTELRWLARYCVDQLRLHISRISLSRGQELSILGAELERHPGDSLFKRMSYQGEKGVDEGGLTREALTFAIDQGLSDYFSFSDATEQFQIVSSDQKLQPQVQSQSQRPHQKSENQRLQQFGRILASALLTPGVSATRALPKSFIATLQVLINTVSLPSAPLSLSGSPSPSPSLSSMSVDELRGRLNSALERPALLFKLLSIENPMVYQQCIGPVRLICSLNESDDTALFKALERFEDGDALQQAMVASLIDREHLSKLEATEQAKEVMTTALDYVAESYDLHQSGLMVQLGEGDKLAKLFCIACGFAEEYRANTESAKLDAIESVSVQTLSEHLFGSLDLRKELMKLTAREAQSPVRLVDRSRLPEADVNQFRRCLVQWAQQASNRSIECFCWLVTGNKQLDNPADQDNPLNGKLELRIDPGVLGELDFYAHTCFHYAEIHSNVIQSIIRDRTDPVGAWENFLALNAAAVGFDRD